MHRSCLTLLLAVMVAQDLLSAKLSAAEPPPIQVICPAIEIEDTPEKSLFGYYQQFRSFQQPELVVLGTVRVLAKDGKQDGIYELEVEKVLYGAYKEKTLLFVGGYYDDSQRRIFALAPGMQAQENVFRHRYSVDPEEEKAMCALGEARLDTHALGCDCIFIGKVIESYASGIVEIVRPLSGNSPDKGQRIKVSFTGFRHDPVRGPASDTLEKPVASHQIYFVTINRFQLLPESTNDEKPEEIITFWAACRQPIDREADVLAALKRRDEYPVTDAVAEAAIEGGKLVRQREVLFRGSIEDAIEFLGSQSEAAVSLGRRKLIHDWQKARPAVLAAIEKLLRQGIEQNRGDYRRLKNLIELVGSLRKETDLKQLIDRYLETVTQRPPEMPTLRLREPEEAHQTIHLSLSTKWEEEHDDFNHGLAWLVQHLDERVVQREYGQKLLRLRDQAKGQWKQEVQLALDICRVEDRLDLEVGLAKMKDVKPVRYSTSGVRHDNHYALAFSNDGKYLATVSYELVRVWRVKDWSLVSEFQHEGSIDRVCFSPDDRFLYLAGQSGAEKVPARRDPVHVRFEWRTGKLNRTYKVHESPLCELELSADGRRMVTASNSDKEIHICDTESGKILHSCPVNVLHQLTFSPDGKTLIWANYSRVPRAVDDKRSNDELRILDWTAKALDGPTPAIKELSGKSNWLFSPAGRHLISAERVRGKDDKDPQVLLRVYDTTKGYVEIARRQERSPGDNLLVSADGKRLVFVANEKELTNTEDSATPTPLSMGQKRSLTRFAIVSLPGLQKISECELFLPSEHYLWSVALSPDGKILAVASSGRVTPYLFNTDTGKRILATKDHTDHIHSVHFPEGGKTLRTIGCEGDICLWDAATLEFRSRIELPGSYDILSIREPDGRYLICQDFGAPGANPVLKVVDAATGKDISSLTLPRREEYLEAKFHWLKEGEVVFCDPKQIIRFHYHSGKILQELTVGGEVSPFRSNSERREDGSARYSITSFPHGEFMRANSIDLNTGKMRLIGDTEMPRSTVNRPGFVPGDKFFYLGGSNLSLLYRQTFQVVTKKQFRKTSSPNLTFNADGSRYAVGMESDFSFSRLLSGEAELQDRVRIYETRSGKMLGAFPTSARAARPERLPGAPLDPGVPLIPGTPPILPPGKVINFSPDGQRLAIINDDDSIELWDLSSLNRGR